MKTPWRIALYLALILGMASADAAHSNDTFVSYRMPVTLPLDLKSPVNYMTITCLGGFEGNSQRLVVFDQTAGYSAPDLSQWANPPQDWPEVNKDIVKLRILGGFSAGGGGSSCSCTLQNAGFTEWLGVLTEESHVGLDRLQTLPSRPEPNTWNDLDADYDPSDSYVQTVYNGPTQGSQSISFEPSRTISNGERVTGNDKFYRIDDGGSSVSVRVVRTEYDPFNPYNYTLSILRASANQDFDEFTDDMVMLRDYIIADASDISNAITHVLNPPPENEYYWINIKNFGERRIDFSATACAIGDYFLQTQFPMILSTESCEDVKCSGATFRGSLLATLISFLSGLLLVVLQY